jgi:hypothetical protein
MNSLKGTAQPQEKPTHTRRDFSGEDRTEKK